MATARRRDGRRDGGSVVGDVGMEVEEEEEDSEVKNEAKYIAAVYSSRFNGHTTTSIFPPDQAQNCEDGPRQLCTLDCVFASLDASARTAITLPWKSARRRGGMANRLVSNPGAAGAR
ncbi:hypothetical protein Dda_1465 [Drechslerella dactyloides]|uniref:Uncharacterized protein n=1 Tax=Drechslerella dactyloides TaxID=74499 RepID=A0AAD6J335_DREDA|nr:hypothetical protein Dda_1465 [Drechslerella dactyloides]